jgi:transposase InsO family protein
MTDNAMNYRRSNNFRQTLERLRIAHRRTVNYRPQTNGKAERFNRTLLEEFAYKELFSSNQARSAAPGPGSTPTMRIDPIRPAASPRFSVWSTMLTESQLVSGASSTSLSNTARPGRKLQRRPQAPHIVVGTRRHHMLVQKMRLRRAQWRCSTSR